MMLAQLIYVPLGLLVLAAFAARLVWRMAQVEARAPGGVAASVLGASA